MDLFEAAENLLGPLGYEVLELESTGSGEKRRVLLRIDRLDEKIVTMDDVTKVTDVFGLELDRLDPFNEPYKLEVASPGSQRPLFKQRHFERFHDLGVKVKRGSNSFKGVVRGANQDSVSIEVDGELRDYAYNDVKVRLAEWPDTPR